MMARNPEALRYGLALLRTPLIGPVIARQLISYCGGTENIFKTPKSQLEKIPGIGPLAANNIAKFDQMAAVDKELDFIDKHQIQTAFYHEKTFPNRLKNIADAPALIFWRGAAQLDNPRLLAVVGTRKPTAYGKDWIKEIITQLKPYNCGIVSGLAYGIDAVAHESAVDNHMETIGVLGHGLDRLYPAAHRNLSKKMLDCNGALLSEFPIDTLPDKENFPKRNRIVAGMTDGVLVVETKNKGGSMITANLSFQYQRDVMALPGRVNDSRSEGCNQLIKSNKAQLVTCVEDIIETLNWDVQLQAEERQVSLFQELNAQQKVVFNCLDEARKMGIDELCAVTKIAPGKLAMILLELEMYGMIRSLPGKIYEVS